MFRPVASAALLSLTLTACGQAETETPLPDTCGAARLSALIGRPGKVLEEMSSVRGPVRLIRPGDAITEDYSETRMNADLDADGLITRIWCG
jgi:Peptidase inhibitor I78 family